MALYLDGVSQTQTHVTGPEVGSVFANSTFYLGARNVSSLWFSGAMACVALYPTALTQSQIDRHLAAYRRTGVVVG